jgi:hypothetical protein
MDWWVGWYSFKNQVDRSRGKKKEYAQGKEIWKDPDLAAELYTLLLNCMWLCVVARYIESIANHSLMDDTRQLYSHPLCVLLAFRHSKQDIKKKVVKFGKILVANQNIILLKKLD